MRLKPGCGCLVLVLALINLLIAISVIYGMVAVHNTSVYMSLGMLVISGANVTVCFLMGRDALRRKAPELSTADGEATIATEEEGEESEVH